jgi:hypothetical protein
MVVDGISGDNLKSSGYHTIIVVLVPSSLAGPGTKRGRVATSTRNLREFTFCIWSFAHAGYLKKYTKPALLFMLHKAKL